MPGCETQPAQGGSSVPLMSVGIICFIIMALRIMDQTGHGVVGRKVTFELNQLVAIQFMIARKQTALASAKILFERPTSLMNSEESAPLISSLTQLIEETEKSVAFMQHLVAGIPSVVEATTDLEYFDPTATPQSETEVTRSKFQSKD